MSFVDGIIAWTQALVGAGLMGFIHQALKVGYHLVFLEEPSEGSKVSL